MLCGIFSCISCDGNIYIIKNKKIKCPNCGLEGRININNFSIKKEDNKVIIIKRIH